MVRSFLSQRKKHYISTTNETSGNCFAKNKHIYTQRRTSSFRKSKQPLLQNHCIIYSCVSWDPHERHALEALFPSSDIASHRGVVADDCRGASHMQSNADQCYTTHPDHMHSQIESNLRSSVEGKKASMMTLCPQRTSASFREQLAFIGAVYL